MDQPAPRTESTLASILLPYVAASLAVIGLVVSGLALSRQGVAAGAAGTAGKPTVVEITLAEFSLTPSHIMVPPGAVTLRVTNAGNLDHNLAVAGLGTLPLIPAGQTKTLELPNVPAGTYDVKCTIPGHAASGMKGEMMAATGADTAANVAAAAPTATSNAEMDQMMEDVAKQFPQKTAGHGGDVLEPAVQPDGTKQYELVAKVVDWEVSKGKIVKAWTYNGVVPAPAIHVNVGDKVRVILHNDLPESTSLHFHGIRVPNAMDGVDPYTQPPIKPGAMFTY